MGRGWHDLSRLSVVEVILPSVETVASSFQDLPGGDRQLFKEYLKSVLEFQRLRNIVYGGFEGYTFLPVEAFKRAAVCCFDPETAETVFESSGTGGSTPSRHYVKDLQIYDRAIDVGFEIAFGTAPSIILGHLPSYAAQSSLVYMVNHLIDHIGAQGSCLFLNDRHLLEAAISGSEQTGHRLILFGASFGLLDLVEKQAIRLPEGAILVETGGMKTHKREIGRGELHERLANGFSIPLSSVRSEYGMCELMSQFYTRHDGLFYGPPWTDIKILDPLDPHREMPEEEEGVLAIFDLANVYSASAILTADRATRHGSGFKVHGRLSGAELRGCNFLLET